MKRKWERCFELVHWKPGLLECTSCPWTWNALAMVAASLQSMLRPPIASLLPLIPWGVMILFCSRIRKWSSWIWELQALIIFPGLFFRNLKLIFKFFFWVWFNILICLPSVGALSAPSMTRKWRISQPHWRHLLSARQPWSWWAVSMGSSGPCVRRSFITQPPWSEWKSCLTGSGLWTLVLNCEAVPWEGNLLAPRIDRTVKRVHILL